MTVFERIKELATKQGESLQTVAEKNGFSSNLFTDGRNLILKARI